MDYCTYVLVCWFASQVEIQFAVALQPYHVSL